MHSKKDVLVLGQVLLIQAICLAINLRTFFLKKKKQQQLELSFSRIFFLFIECLENGANLI